MKELVATLTERGQVTVPAEVRDLLGLRPRDQVVFAIDDGRVQLKPARFTLDTAFQSVPSLPPGISVEDAVRVAKDQRAKRHARKLRPEESDAAAANCPNGVALVTLTRLTER